MEGEDIKSGTNGPRGWQKFARDTYRRAAEAKKTDKLPETGTNPVNRNEMLDEVEAQGRRIRERSCSASDGIQSEGVAEIEIRDDESGHNPAEIAARRIIDAPSKDHLSE